MTSAELLVLGVSVRAAALSARQAGFSVVAVDRFGDQDLVSVAQAWVRLPSVRQLRHLPDSLQAYAGLPVLYLGPFENYPRVLVELQKQHPLLGVAPDALRKVRNPYRLSRWLQAHGFASPRTVPALNRGDLADAVWLRKSRRSAGGLGVKPWGGATSARTSRRCYFQEFVSGQPVSGLYWAGPTGTFLLGVTRQLIGDPAFGVCGFRYCGSLGPLPLARSMERELQRLGQELAQAFYLKGIFGIDGIVRDGTFWVVEVNPRWTASVELLELASGRSMVLLQQEAFQERSSPAAEAIVRAVQQHFRGAGRAYGKAILFARQLWVRRSEELPWPRRSLQRFTDCPAVADLPWPRSTVPPGAPILTVMAQGDSISEVYDKLREMADEVYETGKGG
jgi:predicted ATP-grasp superfamily ATP-dependent carboligase